MSNLSNNIPDLCNSLMSKLCKIYFTSNIYVDKNKNNIYHLTFIKHL